MPVIDPEIYKSDNYLVFDFETTNLDKGSPLRQDNRIVLAAWQLGSASLGQRITCEPIEACQDRLRDDILSSDFIVAHNAKFELGWLKRCGLDLRSLPPVYDTMLGEYVLAGNRGWKLSLDQTALRYGLQGKQSFVSTLIHAGVCPSMIPRGPLISYNQKDVQLTHEVFLRQRPLLVANGLLPVFTCRNLLVPVLADIEPNGMQLDEERVRATRESIGSSYRQAADLVDQITGGINFRSGKQLREFLYGRLGFAERKGYNGPARTPAGNPKTDGETIAALVSTTKEQKDFKAAWEKLDEVKNLEAIIQKLEACVNDVDGGKLYAQFNQTRTQTHRLSSTGGKYKVQFQNFPRSFKRLFRAEESGDYLLVEADAPQLEFRCAGDMGDDPKVARVVCEGIDVHKLTQDVIGLDRDNSKPYTFKPLYGGDSGTPKERAYYAAFREEYSATYNTQTKWTHTVLKDKQLTIPSGLKFYWPDTKLQNSGYITNKASIFNYPIQSFATADIIPIVLWLIWKNLGGMKTKIISTIHDSVVALVHKTELERYREIVIDSFTKDVYPVLEQLYNYKFKIPLGVGIKVGQFWGEGKEEKVLGDPEKIKSCLNGLAAAV